MLKAMALLLAAAPSAELPIDAATLARLPRSIAVLTAYGRTSQCEGVRLADLSASAGWPAGDALSGLALLTLIIAEAADGYRVVFTLAELDPKLGNRPVVLADRCDGQPLSAQDGPLRLVAPGEVRAARSVRQVTRLRVETLTAPAVSATP